jgi:ribose-phosphate pyrophosphokinase
MIVVPGPASVGLGGRVAAELKAPAVPVDHRTFPDGESYIRISGDVKGEHVAVVQTTAPDPERKLMQLLLTAGAARDAGASRVTAVVPYLAYARQDKRFLPGEAFSLDTVMGLLESAGVSGLVVVDVHNEDSIRGVEARHGVRVSNISAIPLIAGHLKREGYGGALSLSPDFGAIQRAVDASRVLGGPSSFFEKTRDRTTGAVSVKAKGLDVHGKRAAVFDDIISSGGTMALAVAELKAQGAERVAAACTHALFTGGAEDKIRKAGADRILATDTVETPFSDVTVAGLVAAELLRL